MNPFFRYFKALFEELVTTPSAPPHAKTLVIAKRVPSMPSRRRRNSILVKRAQTAYWQERGWKKNESGIYEGRFQTRFGAWDGYATVSPSNRVEIFIRNPPKTLEKHPHWPCFRKRSDGWFFIHPITRVPDLSSGILAAEKTIIEAYAS